MDQSTNEKENLSTTVNMTKTQEKWLIHEHINAGNSIDYYHLFDSYDCADEFLNNYVQKMKAFLCMDRLSDLYEDENDDSDDEENNDNKVSFDDYVKEYIKNPLDGDIGGTIYFKDDDYLVMTKFCENYARRP